MSPARIPSNDGAGTVDAAVGEGVNPSPLDSRMWIGEAAMTGSGSCQEFGVVRSDKVARLPGLAPLTSGHASVSRF